MCNHKTHKCQKQRKTNNVHEYSNEDKCFKRTSNYKWSRTTMTEINTLGKKIIWRIFGIHTKHVFPNLNQQVLEGEGYGFWTLQHSNFEGSFSSESMELEKE